MTVIIRFRNILIYSMLTASVVSLLVFPKQISDVITKSLVMCVNIIVPSLFPFFVVSSLVIDTGMAKRVGKLFDFFMKPLFNVPGSCSPAFFLGILSGYPVGAKTAISLYKNKDCSKTEAERLLSFTNNTGPAFVLGAIGVGVFNDIRVGLMLFLSQLAASVTTGILFRFYKYKRKAVQSYDKKSYNEISFSSSFVVAIQSACINIIYIVGFIIFFAVIIKILYLFNIIPWLSGVLAAVTGVEKELYAKLLAGFFEMTTGVNIISPSLLHPSSLAITGAILGWAGLSVHCQVISFLYGSGLSSKPYIYGKLITSVITAFYTYIVASLYPFQISVSKVIGSATEALYTLSFSDIFKITVIECLIFLIVMILLNLSLNKNKGVIK